MMLVTSPIRTKRMIIGVGCDIIDHHEIEELGWLTSDRISNRIFSLQELSLCQPRPTKRFLAGRFAGKEAVLKSLGTGMKDGIALTDVEILQTTSGQPFIKLLGNVEKIAMSMG